MNVWFLSYAVSNRFCNVREKTKLVDTKDEKDQTKASGVQACKC